MSLCCTKFAMYYKEHVTLAESYEKNLRVPNREIDLKLPSYMLGSMSLLVLYGIKEGSNNIVSICKGADKALCCPGVTMCELPGGLNLNTG